MLSSLVTHNEKLNHYNSGTISSYGCIIDVPVITLAKLFLGSVDNPANSYTPRSKVDAEIIAVDEGTSSRKMPTSQDVQDETPTSDHLSAPIPQQLLRKLSDLIPLSNVENRQLVTPITPIFPQPILCAPVMPLGKSSDLIPISNAEKRLPTMPITSIFAQPILRAQVMSSVLNIIAIASKRHCKAVLAELTKQLEQLEVEVQGADSEIHKVNDETSRNQHLIAHLTNEHTNLMNTPMVSSKDSEDLEALCISLEEERVDVAQLKWMD
ncbi:hypothetical protein ACH5RR_018315 [Cinchona calisaya]|uniref:Uncharacterized protein n=1 Tax=Cinchona calisaya TaxID=153742 RepID=A0ABD2ZMS1_9GENT